MCGVVYISEFRGKYLNVNVLRGTTDDGRLPMTKAHMAYGQVS
jgi:hypothetical protein